MTCLHSGLGSKYKFEADPLVIDGVMFIPTGNEDIFALNAKAGKLFDQMYNGQMRKGIYRAGKTGWLYFLDRTNGLPLIGMEEKPVPHEPRQFTAATQPYPVGDAFVSQCPEPLPAFPLQGCIYTPYWDVPVLNVPTHSAGSNFNPTSYAPTT